MRIESMTATFGKLEHETITFQPGLNVISGENEWGKSTWCAFLLAMLYGMDTREKTTKNSLAAKEHYAPWSGAPMSGRMDVQWQGRKITLERVSRGRIPMGEFRAYETESGLSVPELTGENCGQMLLGVEAAVFTRAGFIRQTDLPVTGGEALRDRLTALVTTGDETGDAGRLADGLKNLRNKCKYNRTGLIPQARARQVRLEEILGEISSLETRCAELETRQREGEAFRKRLANHLLAMENRQAEEDAQRVKQARLSLERANRELQGLESFCADLPSREEAESRLESLTDYVVAWDAVTRARDALDPEPEQPACLPAFRGLDGKQALKKAEADAAAYRDSVGMLALLLSLLGMLALMGGMILAVVLKKTILGLACGGLGTLILAWALLCSGKGKGRLQELGKGYGTPDWKKWPELADQYAMEQSIYLRVYEDWNRKKTALEDRLQALAAQKEALCEGHSLGEMETLCRQVLESWDRRDAVREQAAQAQVHLDALLTMARAKVQPVEDDLRLTRQQTQDCLEKTEQDLAQLRHELGVCRGRMAAMGDRQSLEWELQETKDRIEKLEKIYDALNLAQDTLTQATQSLQRRFAPRISRLAQGYLQAMTDGKYDKLTLTEDLTLLAAGREENAVRETLWRSDGTSDQLYLSLRLAVAKLLTPEAPLILDDALVRFDDRRLRAAMKLLKEQGEEKQILLFTCQSREACALAEIHTAEAPDRGQQSAGHPGGWSSP